ncbi:MAG: hypothetical protein JOZ80_01650 [Acidobacteriaceae bacterium]|nr:hypothetical protein [Acidobacteriaceae bacterium]
MKRENASAAGGKFRQFNLVQENGRRNWVARRRCRRPWHNAFHGRQKITLSSGQEMLIRITGR